jgi:beta-barrel assembly-enhancing protease
VPQYTNPQLPEEVNNSDRQPLRSFFALAGAAALVGIAAALAFAFLGGALARYLPYESEVALISPYAAQYPPSGEAAETYLQALTDRLAARMRLPEGMRIQVHYVDQEVVNAFATLGGHVAVYRGLLERMPDENALAMVLAHEVGHARHRHPIATLGRGIGFAAALSIFSAGAGSGAAERILGQSGMLTLLTFSRAQEEEADDDALAALVAAYGHAGGATETFRAMSGAARERGVREPPKFLSTHPVTPERIARLERAIAANGWKPDGARTPIPQAVRDALKAPPSKAPAAQAPRCARC